MIDVRRVEADADLETWAATKSAIAADEPVTVEQLRRSHAPERLLLLAELDGALAGCGIGDRSHFPSRAFVAPRVLPQFRGRGVGTALLDALLDYARDLGVTGLSTFVDGREGISIAFARRRGLVEVDRQIEQVRDVGDEPPPEPPPGVELTALDGHRAELLREAYELAREG